MLWVSWLVVVSLQGMRMLEHRGGNCDMGATGANMAVNSSCQEYLGRHVRWQFKSIPSPTVRRRTHIGFHILKRGERDWRERNWPPSQHTHTHTAAQERQPKPEKHGERKQQAVEYIEARRACSRFQKLQSLHGDIPGGAHFAGDGVQ
ncbi:hypothetical protein M431DRAFT_403264 [Trichoderma harzianum CBS 226.95]|uniref:Secreted protein n=1 Tax=Trichoderma harzianum CBS 226.95 TaxID=983964 RepID=A0A2T4AET6_TRIHA|nr:hypothetical protein M431DRAFT_403264 [Trichoderma harzianum CBS 226.95]PTB55533.1 hypothetical protein M431DRAFT_403264 [Trichoderma harzianum CBS 226.95]